MVGLILVVLAGALFVAAEISARDRHSRALAITGAIAILAGSFWSALSEGRWWAPPAGLVVAGLWILIDSGETSERRHRNKRHRRDCVKWFVSTKDQCRLTGAD